MVKNWRKYAARIAEAARTILPGSKIYVFGSVVKGEPTGGSDVDILIFSESLPRNNLERAKIKVKIEELSNLPPYHPFEIHIVGKEEGEWYFSRIKELVEY
ncbi:MAG: nucleotidyltransferase domain-containing protein [Candidatus Brockarchaeota archaeon]|nr:nucleotidyltransferase domain-containing protein [Candidatus Brockarchaeota archaeon]